MRTEAARQDDAAGRGPRWAQAILGAAVLTACVAACAARTAPAAEAAADSEDEPSQALPKWISAAWGQAVARSVWVYEGSPGLLEFSRDEPPRTGRPPGSPRPLPGFHVWRNIARTLSSVPGPEQPFGLVLDQDPIDDAMLESLVYFDQLQMLKIHAGPPRDPHRPRLAGPTAAGLAQLAKLPRLESLTILGGEFTLEGVQRLARIPKLRSLGLFGTSSEAALAELGAARGLKRLALRSAAANDALLAALAGLKSLEHLDLYDTATTTSGLQHLAGRNLLSLRLPVESQTDAGFVAYRAALAPAAPLRLDQWKITPGLVRELAKIDRRWIEEAAFEAGDASARGREALASLPGVRRVGLKPSPSGWRLDDLKSALKDLQGASLEILALEHCVEGLPAKCVAPLESLPSLRELSVSRTCLDQIDFAALARLRGLRTLELDGRLRRVGMKADWLTGIEAVEGLDSLHLVNAFLPDEGLSALAALPRLRRLTLDGSSLTDAAVPRLAALPALETLSAERTGITPAALEAGGFERVGGEWKRVRKPRAAPAPAP